MKKLFTLTLIALLLLFLVTECNRPESPSPEPQEFGYLSLSVALQIEALPTGRIEAVSPDNFLVTIHDARDGSEGMRGDTYLEVAEEVQLPTGSYYVRATNLEFPADAAFEQPWYFGESDVFTIDKEELKTIDVECALANCKISFNYSQNVQDNFTNWDATATIDDGNGTGDFLEWLQNDPAQGYFLTDFPIAIEVFLEYIKLTDPNQSITRTFNHTITDPQPATHYLINVDASLEDGKIMINITIDDSFTTEEINLGDQVSFRSCKEILDAGKSTGDGIYEIDVDGNGGNDPYDCYCDMTTDGGGWTRVWGKIINSTGHPSTNILWEEALNRIPNEIENAYTGLNIWNQIIGEKAEGEIMHFWYNSNVSKSFKGTIQKFSPDDNYTIKLSNYTELIPGSGSHGLFIEHNFKPFSTVDRDNDLSSLHCSERYSGSPFWFYNCWSASFWGNGELWSSGNGVAWPGSGYGSGFYYLR